MTDISSVRAQIRSLLKLTTDLLDICYDCEIETRKTPTDESIDLGQISNQLVELRNALETLFEAAKTNGAHPPGIVPSVDVLYKLLSTCRNNINQVETALKQQSSRKRIKGPSSSSSPQEILTNLASSAVDLKRVVGGIQQPSTGTSVGHSVVYLGSTIDSSSSESYIVQGNQYLYNSLPTKDADREKIRRWLSAPDPSSNHYDSVRKRGPDTGLWLIKGDLLKNWKVIPHSFAWFYGIPGCGKSVLCSTVIQDVANHCKENVGFALAYFYFDFTDPLKQKTSSLIRSFLTQLSFQLPVCPDVMLRLHAACQGGSQQASTPDAMKALKSIIGHFQHVYFIIDALDECFESDQGELLAVLTEIADWKLHDLHVLVTSRRGRNIEKRLTQIASSHTNLDSDLVDEDIRRYLRTTLVKDTRFNIWFAAERQEIEDKLVQGAHGTFRWVTCQLDELARCDSSLHGLRKALHSLPSTLEETYDRILRKIPKRHRVNVVKLLKWLAFSARPLALVEIVETFTIGQAQGDTILRFDPDRRPRESRMPILDICSGLIALSHRKDSYSLYRLPEPALEYGTLTLAHLSVKEYLISEDLRNSESSSSYYYLDKKLADSAISCDCLAYLLQFNTLDCLCGQSKVAISFGRYAAEFWITHARSDDGIIQNNVQQLAARLLSSSSVHFNNWITLFNVDGGYPRYSLESSYNVPHPLYYASLLGLSQVVNELVLSSALTNVNLVGGRYGSALGSASASGHKKVVQILLAKGADVNMAGVKDGNALELASANGHQEVVQILLGNGIDVNMAGGYYGSALASASVNGRKEVVQILLENGADVNMVGGTYGSALASAAANGHKEVVRLLLETGADVNITGGHDGSALASASDYGHKEVVQLLLKTGANVNMVGGYYGSALASASTRGRKEVVQILLEHGADVNIAGGYHGSALASASAVGDQEIVQILLEKGANVNMAARYGSALALASARGYKEVVQTLLKKGADVHSLGGGNPLRLASANGHLDVVRILLDHGANVSSNHEDAMKRAREESERFGQLLLDRPNDY